MEARIVIDATTLGAPLFYSVAATSDDQRPAGRPLADSNENEHERTADIDFSLAPIGSYPPALHFLESTATGSVIPARF